MTGESVETTYLNILSSQSYSMRRMVAIVGNVSM
jgi:hypothetical protein